MPTPTSPSTPDPSLLDALWRPAPEQIARTQLSAFAAQAAERSGRSFANYAALHAWSVDEREAFWALVWEFCGVVGERGERICIDRDRFPGARWFPDARLSYAENLLQGDDADTAIVGVRENGARRSLSFAALRGQVAAFAAALREAGITRGERVAALVPNVPESAVAMLAANALGALWSSCSPDFGTPGVIDRFGQIAPRVLVIGDGTHYGGKPFDTLARLPELLARLPSVRQVFVVSVTREPAALRAAAQAAGHRLFDDALAAHSSAPLAFERLPFDHPLAVLYSSGTTGKPKCIVHGAGGALLQHLKEHRLHVDLRPGEPFFYFSTCGWMMWNWLVSGLASRARVVLYDGSPFHPDPNALFTLAQREKLRVLGLSAKFVDACAKQGLHPAGTHDLSSVRTILSTGSPLVPEGFDYLSQRVRPGVPVVSISGGTDILSCFVLGNPNAPVWRGEIQAPGLGMAVEVLDDEGRPLERGSGELTCAASFPSTPVGFWNDPDGERFRAAYFERFPGRWCHGDWIRRTDHGGFVIEGRSDAVLNPGGVRIGTAEITRQVERLDEVVESVAIGQEWDGDVRVVLFVVLRDAAVLDDALRDRIRKAVRENASPRHVPARIAAVPDIPRTRSGKLTELAIRNVVHGLPVRNLEALANPEALEHFRDRPELAQ